MGSENVVNGLSFCNQRSEQFANFYQPFRCSADTDSGIPQFFLVGCIGPVSGVVGVVAFAGFLLLTAGTNIRRFLQLWAVRRLITGTQLPAVVFLTELTTVNAGVNRFCWAKIPTQTRGIQDTVIPVIPEALHKNTVTFHLP